MTLDAATITEGILGLEAQMRWEWLEQHLAANTLVMNDLDAWPRYKMDKITGLYTRADREVTSDPRKGGPGEVHYRGNPRGRTIVYEGRVQARTLPELRHGVADLRTAFDDLQDDHKWMEHVPHPDRGGVGFQYLARVLSCDVDDEQERGANAVPTPWQRPFVLSMRQVDPRYYLTTEVHYSGAGGATVAVTNDGRAASEPRFVLTGVGTGPVLSRAKLGGGTHTLDFSGSGGIPGPVTTLTVDFFNRTAVGNDGVDYAKCITFASTWWDDFIEGILAGTWNVTVTGCTSWDLYFRPAEF